jgi:hypothetical protein
VAWLLLTPEAVYGVRRRIAIGGGVERFAGPHAKGISDLDFLSGGVSGQGGGSGRSGPLPVFQSWFGLSRHPREMTLLVRARARRGNDWTSCQRR